ncbi:MAG: hypothetical protein NWE90_05875 [Candidatus Bathyarchaeota archaeon]|nr:hypothetical protein [Candidatus Bathyarchaeota archaeon]
MKNCTAGIFGIAIIWVAVLFASALILQDTEYFSQMLPILGGGAAACLIVLAGCRRHLR